MTLLLQAPPTRCRHCQGNLLADVDGDDDGGRCLQCGRPAIPARIGTEAPVYERPRRGPARTVEELRDRVLEVLAAGPLPWTTLYTNAVSGSGGRRPALELALAELVDEGVVEEVVERHGNKATSMRHLAGEEEL